MTLWLETHDGKLLNAEHVSMIYTDTERPESLWARVVDFSEDYGPLLLKIDSMKALRMHMAAGGARMVP